jgi:hypothetical protein
MPARLFQECSDGHGIIATSLNLPVRADNCHIDRTIEHWMNLRHPCISGIIDVVLPSQLSVLRIVGIDSDDNSLSRIVSTSRSWRTPTARAKAVVRLVLGLRFAHSFGFPPRTYYGGKLFLNEKGVIQITDFRLNDCGGISGKSWTPKADVREFTRLLSEIMIGSSGEHGCGGSGIPLFVLEMIERGDAANMKGIE